MAQPILAIDSYSTPPQVYRLNPADPSDPGSAIGGSLPLSPNSSTNAALRYASNAVIRHGTKVYAWHERDIYVYDETNPSADWTFLYQLPSTLIGLGGAITGFYKILIDGEPHLCGLASASTSSTQQHFSWNLTTNTLRADGTFTGVSITNAGIRGVGFYKEFIFYMNSTNNSVGKFNFFTNVFSSVTSPTAGFSTATGALQFATWDEGLYVMHCRNTDARWGLFEFDETLNRFDEVWNSGYQFTSSGAGETKGTAWEEDGYLYILFPCRNLGGTGDGWQLYRMDKATGVTLDADLTTSLPVNLRLTPPSSNAPAWNDRQRWTTVIDQANPASPQTTLYLHETGDVPALALTAYNWNDPTLTSIDTGTASNYFIAREIDGGGDKFWTPNDIQPIVEDVTVLGANVRVRFRLAGSSSTSLVNIRLYWALTQGVPTNLGTLTNPSHGSISGGNTMTNLTADDEATLYSVEWRAQNDGIVDLDHINFILDPS